MLVAAAVELVDGGGAVPVVIFHAEDAAVSACSVGSREAVNQHRVILGVVHDPQEFAHVFVRGRWSGLSPPVLGWQAEVINVLVVTEIFLIPIRRTLSRYNRPKADDRADAVVMPDALEAVGGKLPAAVQHAF